MRPRKPTIKPRQVKGAKYLAHIIDVLRTLHDERPDPKRRLHYDELCAWLLLYFFSPVLTSLRGLQQASLFDEIQRRLKLPRFSLGSFSEAGTVFDPELLVPIMEQIAGELGDIETDPRLLALERRPTPVDGTLIEALPKMVWALWCDEQHRAAKLHLQLDLLSGAPEKAVLTDAQTSETRTLEASLSAGRLYICDRGYFDYDLMAAIMRAESSFVTRVRDWAVYDVVQENPISAKSAAAGVERDAIVRVGCKNTVHKIDRPLRLVRIHVTQSSAATGVTRPKQVDPKTKMYRTREVDHTIILLTDLVDVDVELIALLYRYRWHIELFFRWFKKVLQADRLLALSENGLTIVVYCGLIASMLVTLGTGRKPTKRTFELLCFYFGGWVSDAELIQHLNRLAAADSKK